MGDNDALGVSGLSRSMQDLLRRIEEPAAAQAVELFCYHARRHLGALVAVLGGLDRLVFTGGIGANAPAVRAKISARLEHLGIVLDADVGPSYRIPAASPFTRFQPTRS